MRIWRPGRESLQFRKGGRTRRSIVGDHGRMTPDEARSAAKKLLGGVELPLQLVDRDVFVGAGGFAKEPHPLLQVGDLGVAVLDLPSSPLVSVEGPLHGEAPGVARTCPGRGRRERPRRATGSALEDSVRRRGR